MGAVPGSLGGALRSEDQPPKQEDRETEWPSQVGAQQCLPAAGGLRPY
jgi:hypothetical protein